MFALLIQRKVNYKYLRHVPSKKPHQTTHDGHKGRQRQTVQLTHPVTAPTTRAISIRAELVDPSAVKTCARDRAA